MQRYGGDKIDVIGTECAWSERVNTWRIAVSNAAVRWYGHDKIYAISTNGVSV